MNAITRTSRANSASSAFVSIVSHTAGFFAGLLAAFGMILVMDGILWLVGSNIHWSLAAFALLMVVVAFGGGWQSAAAATKLALLKEFDPAQYEVVKRELEKSGLVIGEPAKQEPKLPEGYFECVYKFLDADGTVLLETQDSKELKKALYSGRVRPDSICRPNVTPDEINRTKPLCKSKFVKYDFVAALLKPYEHYKEVANSFGSIAATCVFIGVWIAAHCQGNLAELSWPAYIGAILGIMLFSVWSCMGIALALGQMAAEGKVRIAESLGYAVEGEPMSQLKCIGMLMGSGVMLGGLVILSVKSF